MIKSTIVINSFFLYRNKLPEIWCQSIYTNKRMWLPMYPFMNVPLYVNSQGPTISLFTKRQYFSLKGVFRNRSFFPHKICYSLLVTFCGFSLLRYSIMKMGTALHCPIPMMILRYISEFTPCYYLSYRCLTLKKLPNLYWKVIRWK